VSPPILSIGPGAESVRISIYAADPDAGRWDRATWDGGAWASLGWQGVGCDVGEATYKWGAGSEAGILSTAEAGEIDLGTIDPARELDPLNAASPYYGSVRPGTPVRISGVPAGVAGAVVNPSFELSPALTGWTPSAPALAEQSPIPDAPEGAYSLRLFGDGVTVSPAVSQTIPVSAGLSITLSAYARCAAGVEARLRVDGLDAAGATIASGMLMRSTTSAAFVAIGGTLTVPPGVTQARLFLYIPGTPAAGLAVRFDAISWVAEPLLAATGFVDEASYDLASARGRIRAVDGIAYLAQAQVPDGTVLPNTLRARVRAIVAAVGLGTIVPVEPEATTDPDVDPPVSPHDSKSAPAWQLISNAAQDALVYVWLDPTGMLRFRSWGSFPDAAFAVGCPPGDADPAETWLLGLSTIGSTAAANAIRNRIRAYSSGTTWSAPISDGVSVQRYGPRPLDVDRVVPDLATWAGRILADRADAGLEVGVGMIRPYTPAELASLLSGILAGPSVVRVRDDAHGELVDLDVGMIGATVGVTPAGWRFSLVSMVSRVDWEAIEPEPPIPPIPPADPWHVETRSYIATADALIALTSGGAKYGAGAATSLPVGAWQGWQYRGLVKFAPVPWAKVRAIRSATLNVRSTSQVRVGFGSSPKCQVRRITGAWNAGSSSSPSSGNSVVWPGPTTTATGAVTASLPTGQNVDRAIRVDALVRPWAPASVGGSGAAQQGLALYEASSSANNTGEVWPVEQGGAARPSLDLVLEIFD
jgi:hypothetical protein